MIYPQRFAGQVALVTGAASGIGASVARRLAAEGACLMLVDRNQQQLESLAKELDAPESVLIRTLDVADEQQMQEAVTETVSRLGGLHILCNNAGIASNRNPATDQDLENWQQVLQVNLLGVVNGTKYASREMVRAGKGVIINTASIAGLRSGAGGNAYSASKAAVINFTQTSACDLGQYGIRVNAVCPGLVETGMTQVFFDKARDKGIEDKLGARCELLRAGRPEEVASVILFLASDDASYMTGQALAVDGGNTASLNMPGMKV
ncbi:SDR family NAD(P)-dependent oxidoreductase [Marinospirillum sp.]|uniref:SDR family NAD(P)-dependent oxidoreductase n=1 Tax=Marinospirillum sp. TaxID=2183934 RepID=UPI002870A5C5|nr:SDR family NAD(P)-dependent oxidoreductase [Marinospirillum sp.]MDR9467891.1 SDR family NAD(P)-dependent oxidoreductase [Marinospirillum sp.]